MIDFLEQHGFEPFGRFNGLNGNLHLINNSHLQVAVDLDSYRNEIVSVYLVIPAYPVVDFDDADRFINIRVPNCDNKLALYTLLHNFNLLPE